MEILRYTDSEPPCRVLIDEASLSDLPVQRVITMRNYPGHLPMRQLCFLYFNQLAMHGLPLIFSYVKPPLFCLACFIIKK